MSCHDERNSPFNTSFSLATRRVFIIVTISPGQIKLLPQPDNGQPIVPGKAVPTGLNNLPNQG
jgi:hypothetical protein